MKTQEKEFSGFKASGFVALSILIIMLIGSIAIIILFKDCFIAPIFGVPLFALSVLLLKFGLFQIEPNEARVMIYFGKYEGTIKQNGFYFCNPLYNKKKITLRARNLEIEPIKVNDKVGNPIMIGSVIVWRIKDTYKAMFDIDSSFNDVMRSCESFVLIQSDAALRQVAGMYAYDNNDHEKDAITLRSDGDDVSQKLENELNTRLAIAGIEVIEARINYLAYAAEIASVMLRRQQADAIISAREKIVEGAVSMVQLALNKLAEDNIVELDEERKAAMVSNLLVVLCADEAAQPIVNAGTLHH